MTIRIHAPQTAEALRERRRRARRLRALDHAAPPPETVTEGGPPPNDPNDASEPTMADVAKGGG